MNSLKHLTDLTVNKHNFYNEIKWTHLVLK